MNFLTFFATRISKYFAHILKQDRERDVGTSWVYTTNLYISILRWSLVSHSRRLCHQRQPKWTLQDGGQFRSVIVHHQRRMFSL